METLTKPETPAANRYRHPTHNGVPSVVDVQAEADFMLRLRFRNGDIRLFDMKPHLADPRFEQLSAPAVFADVYADGPGIAWGCGLDLGPYTLVEESVLAPMLPGELKDARKALAMNQAQLAAALDMSANHISDMECGRKPIQRTTQLAVYYLQGRQRLRQIEDALKAIRQPQPWAI